MSLPVLPRTSYDECRAKQCTSYTSVWAVPELIENVRCVRNRRVHIEQLDAHFQPSKARVGGCETEAATLSSAAILFMSSCANQHLHKMSRVSFPIEYSNVFFVPLVHTYYICIISVVPSCASSSYTVSCVSPHFHSIVSFYHSELLTLFVFVPTLRMYCIRCIMVPTPCVTPPVGGL